MTENLRALEEWAGLLLTKLSPGERRKIGTTIGRELRRSQQQRITAQRNPDGTGYKARKPRQLRGKVGRVKRQMFVKLRQAKYLRLRSTPNAVAIGFFGRLARIARVHQFGLKDRPARGQSDVQYDRRELLGFSAAELSNVRDRLLDHLLDHLTR